jgi:hypothetical protein
MGPLCGCSGLRASAGILAVDGGGCGLVRTDVTLAPLYLPTISLPDRMLRLQANARPSALDMAAASECHCDISRLKQW